jgi:hypothetical protein
MDFFGVLGFLLGFRFSLGISFSFYDTNMLPKVICDKTAFVKFKIINNFKQIIDGF